MFSFSSTSITAGETMHSISAKTMQSYMEGFSLILTEQQFDWLERTVYTWNSVRQGFGAFLFFLPWSLKATRRCLVSWSRFFFGSKHKAQMLF
jgi:hypothetical protein